MNTDYTLEYIDLSLNKFSNELCDTLNKLNHNIKLFIYRSENKNSFFNKHYDYITNHLSNIITDDIEVLNSAFIKIVVVDVFIDNETSMSLDWLENIYSNNDANDITKHYMFMYNLNGKNTTPTFELLPSCVEHLLKLYKKFSRVYRSIYDIVWNINIEVDRYCKKNHPYSKILLNHLGKIFNIDIFSVTCSSKSTYPRFCETISIYENDMSIANETPHQIIVNYTYEEFKVIINSIFVKGANIISDKNLPVKLSVICEILQLNEELITYLFSLCMKLSDYEYAVPNKIIDF